MGTCTSGIADDVITMTRRHSHSLKSPLKRALSLTSVPSQTFLRLHSSDDKMKSASTATFHKLHSNAKSSQLPLVRQLSCQTVSKTASQLDCDRRQELKWQKRLMMKLRSSRRRSVAESEKVVTRKNAMASPVDEWLTCMDSPLRKSLQKQVRF